MALIILDRDRHYIGAKKDPNGVMIMHRNFDRKEFEDSDDLLLSEKGARKLANNMLKRVPFEIKEDRIGAPKINIRWNKDELGIHYGRSWIGVGKKEAEILQFQIKECLKGKR